MRKEEQTEFSIHGFAAYKIFLIAKSLAGPFFASFSLGHNFCLQTLFELLLPGLEWLEFKFSSSNAEATDLQAQIDAMAGTANPFHYLPRLSMQAAYVHLSRV